MQLEAAKVGINASVWQKHRNNVEAVLAHPVFAGVGSSEPLGIDTTAGEESGFQAPFNKTLAMTALDRTGQYACAINLLWVDMFFTTSNNIPIMWSGGRHAYQLLPRQHLCVAIACWAGWLVLSARL